MSKQSCLAKLESLHATVLEIDQTCFFRKINFPQKLMYQMTSVSEEPEKYDELNQNKVLYLNTMNILDAIS